MAYYDVTSQYEPGQLVTQSNGMNFGLPGSQQGQGGLNLGGLGQNLGALASQSLEMRRQQALQQMALQERQQALAEAQFSQQAGQQQQAFDYQRQQDGAAAQQAQADRYQAQNDARKARIGAQRAQRQGNVQEAAYGQQVGGFGIVPGMISASGNTPGAVYTGFRTSKQGPTSFASGAQQELANSGASLGPTQLFQPQFVDNSGPSAGEKSAQARRQLLALQMAPTPAPTPQRGGSVSGSGSVRR